MLIALRRGRERKVGKLTTYFGAWSRTRETYIFPNCPGLLHHDAAAVECIRLVDNGDGNGLRTGAAVLSSAQALGMGIKIGYGTCIGTRR